MKSSQVGTPSKIQGHSAERPSAHFYSWLWPDLGEVLQVLSVHYINPETTKIVEKIVWPSWMVFVFLLFVLGKEKRDEITHDYTEILQRAQHSLEYAQYLADPLCILFDFLSSLSLSIVFASLWLGLCVSGWCGISPLYRQMGQQKETTSKVTLLVQTTWSCRFKALLQESRRQHRLLLTSTISSCLFHWLLYWQHL